MNIKHTAILLAFLSGLLIAAGKFPEVREVETPEFFFPEDELAPEYLPDFSPEEIATKKEVTPKYEQFGDFYQSIENRDLVYFNKKWYRKEKTIQAKVTAYEPGRISCGRFADGKTSTGKNAWKMNGVATYPAAIPYGSIVYIEGAGFKIVDDTGAAMRNSWRRGIYHIDLRMSYVYQARKWGVQKKEVIIYKAISK
jgi:3D (Asp-Asp-Asp) domain-containing protein